MPLKSPATRLFSQQLQWNEKVVNCTRFGIVIREQRVATWVVKVLGSSVDYQDRHQDYLGSQQDYLGQPR